MPRPSKYLIQVGQGPWRADTLIAAYGGMSAAKVMQLRRAEARSALRALGEVVYAIRTMDDLVKIGHTTNLAQRITTYGIGGDLQRILFAIPGTRVDEEILHQRFTAHRARRREYYRPAAEVMDHINAVRARLGVAPVVWPGEPSAPQPVRQPTVRARSSPEP